MSPTSPVVLKYPGSKGTLAPWIVAQMPPHRVYLEIFFGSGAVLFAKPRAALETVNDLDGRIANLFRVLRDHATELARVVALTPWARAEYGAVAEADLSGDDVEDARRFLVRCWQSHGSHLDRRSGWRYATGAKRQSSGGIIAPARQWSALPDALLAAVDRLRGVQIECRPALEVIARFAHADCLIYADPPYPRSVRGDAYYRHELGDDDHRALLDALDAHPGPVLLSGYRCSLYDERLIGWERVDRAGRAEGGQSRTESLWLNARAVAGARRVRQLRLRVEDPA